MTERQLRYKLRKNDQRLMKRNDGYMIVDNMTNCVIAGGEGQGYNLSLDQAIEFIK